MISVECIALVMISALLLLITFCLCGNSSDGGFTRNTDSPASSVQGTEKATLMPRLFVYR